MCGVADTVSEGESGRGCLDRGGSVDGVGVNEEGIIL